jgi:hypothetical protein
MERAALGADVIMFPSPLWGGVRGGGRDARDPGPGEDCTILRVPFPIRRSDFAPPTPSPSPQGGGGIPALQRSVRRA